LEKFKLYQKYQEEIHHDPHNAPSSFRNFLVDSPLVVGSSSYSVSSLILGEYIKREPIPYTMQSPPHLPKEYGSYHQLYRLDGQLIAMAVIDILPSCVSSVYFMYDKQWEKFSFGKASFS
jgi:arginine-tRNA-protein transferase